MKIDHKIETDIIWGWAGVIIS